MRRRTPHRRRLRRAAAIAAAAMVGCGALTALILPQTLPASVFFRDSRRYLETTEQKFFLRWMKRAGMEALWSFDESRFYGRYANDRPHPPPDMPDPLGPSFPGTIVVPGRHGSARRFSGREESYIQTEYDWVGMPRSFSVALWFRPKPFPRRQDLLATVDAGRWGFRIDGDRLCFEVTTSNGVRTVSSPFVRAETWTHAAFVSDAEAGELRLYVNGRLATREPCQDIAPEDWPITFGVASARKVRDPLRGDLDDAALWNRALPDDEILRIATSGSSLGDLLAGRRGRCRLWLTRMGVGLVARLGRLAVPRPIPSSAPPSAACSLRMGGGAWRHLSQAHARARRSGCLTEAAARPVAAYLSIGGQTVPCRLSLFGAPSYYPDSVRPSYSILPAEPDGTLPGGALRLVLSPPESCGWLEAFADSLVAEETGIPVAPGCTPVRLRSNGMDRGVFLLRDFSRAGGISSISHHPNRYLKRLPRLVTSTERYIVAPSVPSYTVAGAVQTYLSEEGKARIEARLRGLRALLARDVWSPLSPAERAMHLKESLQAFQALPAGPAPARKAMVDSALLAGANVSDFRVAADLPLREAASKIPAGATLSFRSLSPEWIDDDGRILRRPAVDPVVVPFEAQYRDAAGDVRSIPLEFRLMPESYPVPAISIWTGAQLDKLRREDASALFLPSGPVRNEPARALTASAATHGGLRFRGNSSFLGRKKLLGLKTDAPHGLFPGSPTRALPMINALTDRSLVANSLAFDLFRSFPRADGRTNAAPHVVRAEVFLNGRYFGLQEFAERIDEDLLGCVPGDVVFYRYESVLPRQPDIKPVRPAPREGDFAAPLDEAKALFAEPPSPEWPERALAAIDLDNIVDFAILSNLFGNLNGFPKHWLFDEVVAFDTARRRFFYIPWDFDYTLRDDEKWIETDAERRLRRDVPAFRERMASRWRELRAGCLAPSALRARARALADEISPALPFEVSKWDRMGLDEARVRIEETFADQMRCLEARAAMLDRRLGQTGEATAP